MRTLLGLAVTLLVSVPAAGHHSFATYYFEDQSVTIEGEVVGFDYAAPHAWVHVMAPDAAGTVRRYSAEWSNPRRLARDGVERDTIRSGERVRITGSPGRIATEYRIHLKRIERPADGWRWGGGRRR